MSTATNYKKKLRKKRHNRIRQTVVGTSDRPRLAVFRSNRHVSVQLIDDRAGKTIASASTLEKELREGSSSIEGATKCGELIAKRASELGVKAVVFDRGGFHYHGRIAAIADGARKEGLEF